MTKNRYFVDSSFFIKLAVGSNENQVETLKKYLDEAKDEKIELFVTPETLIEIEAILSTGYKASRNEILFFLEGITSQPYIKIQELTEADLQLVLKVYRQEKVDFADAVLYAKAKSQGIGLISFDKDLAELQSK